MNDRPETPLLLHAGCVAAPRADGPPVGVLILGPSGAGKSRLALRLLALGAALVADDRTLLRRRGQTLRAEAPPAIRGLIEARGIGLLRLPAIDFSELRLAVELTLADPGAVSPEPSRLPERRFASYFELRLPLLRGRESDALAATAWLLARGGELIDPDAPPPV